MYKKTFLQKMFDDGQIVITSEEFRILSKYYQDKADDLLYVIKFGCNGTGSNDSVLKLEYESMIDLSNHYFAAMMSIEEDYCSYECKKVINESWN